jgi:hypothetical protein
MRRLAILFLAIAAALPAAGCASLVDTAKDRCAGAYPKLSRDYEECWHREFDRELQQQNQYLDELSRAASHTGIGR